MSHPRITPVLLAATLTLTTCTCSHNVGIPPATGGQDARVTTAPVIPKLPLVNSFDDLLNTPLITVGREQVHLGLEGATCPANSGILIYCSPVSGHANFDPYSNVPLNERLGPVRIKIVYPRKPPETTRYVNIMKQLLPERNGPVLFVCAARPTEPGPCEIQILAPDNTLLAHRQIQATKPQPSPWLTFDTPEGKAEVGVPPHYVLTNSCAVPKYDGTIPWSKTELLKIDPLPHFIPETPDPDFTASMKDGLVTVYAKPWVDDELPDQWLIRFWINGKPVSTPNATLPELRSRDVGRKTAELNQFQFRLDLDRKLLGAQPNDRLEFQLLHCPDGLDWGAKSDKQKFATSNHPGPRLTNKTPWNP